MKKFLAIMTLLFLGSFAFAQTFPTDKLMLVTSDGKRIEIIVELAISPDARARGLMFRQNLDENKGMIFDFGETESEAAMWMKNTFIPLDMVFIRQDGTIRTIAANTVPHSTDTVLSKGAVKAVLELKGGFAARNGLKEGDKVEFHWFKR